MTAPKFDELVMLEQGPRPELGLFLENLPNGLGFTTVQRHAVDALHLAGLALLDMDKRNALDAEADWPDTMWCHICDAWRETWVDRDYGDFRICASCGDVIFCDDCGKPVTSDGWCTTKGCPSNPLYST